MYDLLPHQIEGRDILADQYRFGLLDDMGLGKTATAIATLDAVDAIRVLVVCPAAVRGVWLGEFRKFGRKPRAVREARSLHDLNLWLRSGRVGAARVDVLAMSYEFATKNAHHVLKHSDIYDALVLDEYHYLKSWEAKRTKAILGPHCDGAAGLSLLAARTYALTGTLMANDPTDCWTLLRFTGATNLTINQFRARYFDASPTAYGARYSPKPGAEEAIQKLLSSVSLRRTKDRVWKDMPAFFVTDVRLDGDTGEVRKLIAQHPDLEDAIRQAALDGGLSALDAPHIATLRRLIGTAKAPPFVAMLDERLRSGLDKAVVMGVHTSALDIVFNDMTKLGYDPVMIVGATSTAQRKAAIERFQKDPKCRVFVGNVRAAGTGLTLTAAHEIFMLEQSWSPADNAQALMRVHRLGQTKNVTGTFVALANTIDDMVVEILAEKTTNIAKIDPTAFRMSA